MSTFAKALSEAQAAAVLGGTNLFLKACPGAGKTRSVAARAAMLASQGQVLALLSYTRVGAAEIGETIVREHGVPLSDQHYIGTLHSFLIRYVLRPFGHLITGSSEAMSIDDEEVEAKAPTGLRAREFEYGVDGQMRRVRGTIVRPDEVIEMAGVRKSIAQAGLVNFSDAISISLQVLLNFPEIARALAARFDEIVIDEAQDTNQLLLACIQTLVRSGLKSLLLVGDYDQAIYEFNGSVPSGCEALAIEVGLETRELRENFRSSQVICDMTAAIRGGGQPDIAAGSFKDVKIAPTLFLYQPGSHGGLAARFDRFVKDSGAPVQSSAILVRQVKFAEAISGSSRPFVPNAFKTLVEVASGKPLTIDDYRAIEDVIVRRTFAGGRRPTGLDRSLIRARAVQLVTGLPALEGDLHVWATNAVQQLDSIARELSPVTTSALAPMAAPASWRATDASMLRVGELQGPVIQTVHSVKGRSIDAVLLVAQVPEQSFHQSNAEVWSSAVGRPRAEMVEELRLGYVALTRARAIAAVALPSITPRRIVDRWLQAGFHPEPAD